MSEGHRIIETFLRPQPVRILLRPKPWLSVVVSAQFLNRLAVHAFQLLLVRK
jgi:hypothetical protein